FRVFVQRPEVAEAVGDQVVLRAVMDLEQPGGTFESGVDCWDLLGVVGDVIDEHVDRWIVPLAECPDSILAPESTVDGARVRHEDRELGVASEARKKIGQVVRRSCLHRRQWPDQPDVDQVRKGGYAVGLVMEAPGTGSGAGSATSPTRVSAAR